MAARQKIGGEPLAGEAGRFPRSLLSARRINIARMARSYTRSNPSRSFCRP